MVARGCFRRETLDQVSETREQLVRLRFEVGEGLDGGAQTAMVALAGMPWPITSPATRASRREGRGMASYQSPLVPAPRPVGR